MVCPYIFYFSSTHHFLSVLEKRVRIGASYYLYIILPEAKAKAKIESYSTLFQINRSAAVRSRNKKKIPPVDLLVLQNRNLKQASLVSLLFLFHLDDSFFTLFPQAERISEKGSKFLNEIFSLQREEKFKSIQDKHNRLTILSYSDKELVPVFTLHKLEIPQRIRGKYPNYSSHQWVVRLHKLFIKGKIEKINFLFEKARNIPKEQGDKSSNKNKEIRKQKQNIYYSKIRNELKILEKMYPSFGIQSDVGFIKNAVFKKNKKAHKCFSFNFTHPTFRVNKIQKFESIEDLIVAHK